MTNILNYLLHNATGEDLNQDMVRSHAKIDGGDGLYCLLWEQEYYLEIMSPGGVTIFMLHMVLKTGKDQVLALNREVEILLINSYKWDSWMAELLLGYAAQIRRRPPYWEAQRPEGGCTHSGDSE